MANPPDERGGGRAPGRLGEPPPVAPVVAVDDDDSAGIDFNPEELAMLRQFFRDEAHEALEAVTARALVASDQAPGHEALTEMMRLTHTLKGSAGTVGVALMVDLAHRLESAFAAVRAGQLLWSAPVADVVVEIADALRGHVDALDDPAGAQETAARARTLLDRLARTTTTPAGAGLLSSAAIPHVVDDATVMLDRGYRLDDAAARAAADGVVVALAGGSDSTRTIVAGAGTGATASTAVALDTSGVVDPRGVLRVEPERIDALMNATGELLFDRTRIERRVQLLRTLARDLGRTRQALRDEIGHARAGGQPFAGLASRLAIVENDLAGQATQLAQATAALLDETDALRRTINELQRGLTRVRMSTARALFTQLGRSVRAIGRAASVRVDLRTHGDDTEFDKAVAEQITDPLVQILRNAVVHGIEPSAERQRRGKPPTGQIMIAARQEANTVIVEVSDDGRGIDPRALRERFVLSGRWTRARSELASDDDVLHAIFDAGMSSRDDADELSGRGIGLDLVRETIARLGGEIRMTSTPGRGTTFTMRLPVSTAVAQAMLFKVHGQVYALPQVHVVETTTVDPDADTVALRHEQLPVVRLENVLVPPTAPTDPTPARRAGIVITYAGKSLVCTVDKVVGPREIVVKQLGPLLEPLPLYAGATISGSGKVQLILDPAALVRLAYPGHAPVEVPSAPHPAPHRLAGRVLVVDDSRAIREALTTMLSREGWIVDVAEDGGRAWDMAQQLGYDLIVTDLEMPRLGGFDLIGRLRGDRRLAPTPVVVITSRATPENRRRARDLGVRSLVAKPVTRRKLVDALTVR